MANPFQKWTLVLTSVNREVITDAFPNNEANTQEIELSENWLEQNLYSRRPSKRKDGVQQRIQQCYLRDGQCGADRVEEILDSMSILPALCIWGYIHLSAGAENLNSAQQRCDESDSRSLRNPKGTILADIHDCLQEIVNAVRTRANNITTRLETHCEVLQKVKGHLPQSGTDGNTMRSTGNLSFLITGRTHGLGTWTTSCTATSSYNAPQSTERKICEFWFICEVLTRTSGQVHCGKDQGTRKRRRNWHICKESERTSTSSLNSSKWTGSVNTTEWLIIHWAEHFAEPQN